MGFHCQQGYLGAWDLGEESSLAVPDTFSSLHLNLMVAPNPVRAQGATSVGVQDTLEHPSFVPRNRVAVDRGLQHRWEQLWGWGSHQDLPTCHLGDSMG